MSIHLSENSVSKAIESVHTLHMVIFAIVTVRRNRQVGYNHPRPNLLFLLNFHCF